MIDKQIDAFSGIISASLLSLGKRQGRRAGERRSCWVLWGWRAGRTGEGQVGQQGCDWLALGLREMRPCLQRHLHETSDKADENLLVAKLLGNQLSLCSQPPQPLCVIAALPRSGEVKTRDYTVSVGPF